MCNSNTTHNFTTISKIDQKPSISSQKSTQTHLFIDLLSLPQENPKQIHEKITASQIIQESREVFKLAFPIALTALTFYSRSILSMLFLGHLGDTELAAGSLAIAFANITGYSVLSGLALGMEPLCSQAFGAQRPKLLSLTLQRSVVFLLSCCLPITFLWVNISHILLYLHQDPNITRLAHTYLVFSLPDLITNSLFHPIRIYLRAQGITYPLTLASLAGTVLHLPLNYLLVSLLQLGVAGVAIASATSNVAALVALVFYVVHDKPTWTKPSLECLTGWMPLVRLAAPSCVSVCLEWWWYEIMILLCGLLVDPKATVASMGILIQTTAFLYVFPSSLSFAVSTRVGNELGANRPDKARLSATVSIFLAGLMGLSAMVFATTMRNSWAKMFTYDVRIIELTSTVLPILGLCELGNCPQTVGCGVVRGTARPTTAANVNLGAFYLVGMPVAVGLGFWIGLGFVGLWVGLLAAQVCCAGLMLYVVGTTNWDCQAMRAKVLTCTGCGGNPVLPDSNYVDKEPLICVMVTSSNADT
ncbi:protein DETOXIFICATION 51-like [Nicotiana tabacum]|uniref:Protein DETOXIFICATION n=2 Tax=Nicotiana TaxID=4085 RepID=A0A1S4D750_TOBAC|nr:PREDICTED: MATE efflux family protein LAL5-like [Nicotiana sylvestris]XP_016509212.1 PREDICTED: protein DETOXIFICATION 51-like [Nicotiana tabacum]